ncbi:MAG TPA: hypothetical protein VFU89_07900 [Rhabdochlamydiaceae bacterium]|nr:hypothetical protein [Rhabdochlamydiaceae bacterium]
MISEEVLERVKAGRGLDEGTEEPGFPENGFDREEGRDGEGTPS